jgi:uncharacterized protein (DUF736 family)
MLVIGSLREIEEKGYRQIYGEIHSLEIDLQFRLASRSGQTSENSPDYSVIAKSRSGKDVEVGSAWRKRIKAGAKVGEEFLTLTIDDPSFPAALNVAAFKNGQPGQWDVGWRRRQDRPAPAEVGDPG